MLLAPGYSVHSPASTWYWQLFLIFILLLGKHLLVKIGIYQSNGGSDVPILGDGVGKHWGADRVVGAQGLVAGAGHESGLFLRAKERKPPFTYLCR